MKNKKVYRITLQYPETGNIDIREIVVYKDISIYDIVEISVNEGLITNEEVNYITAINDITNIATNKSVEDEEKTTLHQAILQAKQVVLRPRENNSTGKQFKHLMEDLQIGHDRYKLMLDNGNITKDEITIVIAPNQLNDVEGMIRYDINKIISILNLNSKKVVSVNYILVEDIESIVSNEDGFGCCDDCNNNVCNNHPNNPCGNCNECDSCGDYEDECDCDECNENCNCYKNPELDCCKSCDTAEDCGCYIHKTNRHDFSYNMNSGKSTSDNNEPEKTIRIPVIPINPKEEIIMLAEAMSKRLAMITEIDGDGKIIISVEKDLEGHIESSLRIKTSYDVMCDL